MPYNETNNLKGTIMSARMEALKDATAVFVASQNATGTEKTELLDEFYSRAGAVVRSLPTTETYVPTAFALAEQIKPRPKFTL